jgi:hypothetical protein
MDVSPHTASKNMETSEADNPSPPPKDHAEQQDRERIVRTATQARGGEIILGRKGRWIWIGSFAAIIVIMLATLFLGG